MVPTPRRPSPWAEPLMGLGCTFLRFLKPTYLSPLPINLSADRGPDPLFGS